MDENPIILWQVDIRRLRFLVLCSQTEQNVEYDWRGDIDLLSRPGTGSLNRCRDPEEGQSLKGRSRCERHAEVEHTDRKEGSDLERGSSRPAN